MDSKLVVSALLIAAGMAQAQEEGRKLFARCSACHAAPDRSIEADRLWTRLVKKSA